MSKYERLARLMQMVNIIRTYNKPDRTSLAERFGVTVRTIQRDINTLCYANVPIFWAGDRYEIMDGFFMPPTNLSVDEALHLISAARVHAERQEGPQREAIESAIEKIIARLPDEIRDDLEAVLGDASSQAQDNVQPLSRGNESNAKILVMDDEESTRTLASELLGIMGYDVDVAKDGSEAISLYRSAMGSDNPFDAVILDLRIPAGMGGKEAVQRLIDIDGKVKAVVCSGYASDPAMTDFAQYGFRDSLAKPYRAAELRNVLDAVMTEKA